MKKRDQILIQNNYLNIFINCNVYKKDDFYIGFVPSLKITSKSILSEEDALIQMKNILKKYFEVISINEQTLQSELERLGWKNLNPPETVTIPVEFLYSKFNMQKIEFALPIAA
ncbi:MAG: hypothetical protein SFY32_04445 [Bacteroidota bacterium]|nr:hypothetical protein [Bacteroidota bacterium]